MLPKASRRESRAIGFGVLILLLIAFSATSGYPQEANDSHPGQERNRSTRPELESKIPSPGDRTRGYTIGVNVDLVLVYATVSDKKGRFVPGLKQENFKVYEDGIEQSVSLFAQEDVPITMGILLDLSGSMRGKIEQVNQAALALIQASNRQDQVFLIGFNEEVELLQDFTSDIDEITDALENIVVMGGTALYDAIYLGVQKASTGTRTKKAIVVITDGEDRDSYYKLNELVKKVQESDVMVFCIGFLNPAPEKGLFGRWSKSEAEKAREALVRIAEETGGKAFFPDKLTDLHDIVSEIASELRSQYSIGYFSSNRARDGTYRRIKIELSGLDLSNKQLRYRRGYYAPKAESADKR